MLKRVFDILASLIGLVLCIPIFIIVSILIKSDSKGPIFYGGTRVGKKGKKFKLCKFRTMNPDASKKGPAITYSDDPRITKIGKLLRNTKIDELPQLLNVLKGEISFVGPRPESPFYVEKYNKEQLKVLDVKPGITGLAQLKFPAEESILKEENLHEDYLHNILPQKLVLDMEYIKKYSFIFDLKILFQTLSILLKGRGNTK
ncbi:MAG: sugar transferase [bacterium]